MEPDRHHYAVIDNNVIVNVIVIDNNKTERYDGPAGTFEPWGHEEAQAAGHLHLGPEDEVKTQPSIGWSTTDGGATWLPPEQEA